jgi:hypothetical protein
MSEPDDPGWRPVLKQFAVASIPGMILSKRVRRGGPDGITTIRFIFLAFALTPPLLGMVVWFTVAAGTQAVPGWVPLGLSAASVAAVLLALTIRQRSLDTSSLPSLAAAYRTRFLIGLMVSEWPAMFGVIAAIVTGRFWLYAISFTGTEVGMIATMPGRRSLERSQEAVYSSGSSLSVTAAHRGTTA